MNRRNMCIVIGVIIGISAVLFLAYALSQNSHVKQEYTRLTVVYGQGSTVTFGENVYVFTYTPKEYWQGLYNAQIGVATKSFAIKSFDAVEGAVYRDFGIEIVIVEVHQDYVLLDVKSTIP